MDRRPRGDDPANAGGTAYNFLADCAAHTLGGHYEQSGKYDSEFVEDFKPSSAQRWRAHERMENGLALPLFLGAGVTDAAVRYSAKRRKTKTV